MALPIAQRHLQQCPHALPSTNPLQIGCAAGHVMDCGVPGPALNLHCVVMFKGPVHVCGGGAGARTHLSPSAASQRGAVQLSFCAFLTASGYLARTASIVNTSATVVLCQLALPSITTQPVLTTSKELRAHARRACTARNPSSNLARELYAH